MSIFNCSFQNIHLVGVLWYNLFLSLRPLPKASAKMYLISAQLDIQEETIVQFIVVW
jgi:hypothetical protein